MLWVLLGAAVVLLFGSICLKTTKNVDGDDDEDGPATTDREGQLLSRNECKSFMDHRCPDCGSALLEGPHGGMSTNYKCENEKCSSKFNYMGRSVSSGSLTHDPRGNLHSWPTKTDRSDRRRP